MRKIISVVLSFGLLFQQGGLVYAAGELNLANYLSQARNAIVQPDIFQPARLRYISYDMANNDFKLLLDKGNAKLNDATPELFNYFLIGLALPNDTFWVNLRPDAADNIIDPILEKTDIGKIFLEADLQLKKDTAGLTSPQNPEGKSYWDKLYKKAGELFGTENITIPTITRPWIVPNEVIVRETEDSAYIYKATLKVMLESDYLIGRGGSRTAPTPDQYSFSDPRLKELNEYSSQIIRETIIPKLTKEVNSSKRYAKLRQVYYSLVLSRWFKQKYSSLGSAGASANSYIGLINSGNLVNLTSKEPCDKQDYFQAYQKSFKDGEYNLKETVPTPFGQSIRSYISGGLGLGPQIDKAVSKLVNTTGEPVRRALEAGLIPRDQTSAFSGSPLEAKELVAALKEIRSDLNIINTKVSSLSRNGHGNNIQSISVPLGQAINSVRIKINSLQKPKDAWEGEVLSYLTGLEKSLGEINSEAGKLVLPKTGTGVEESLKSLPTDMKAVLSKVSELYEKLQNSAGSALTLEDYVNYVEKIRGKLASFYQWESKKSSDATLDDLIEAAKRAGESKLKPNAMELPPEAEEWYGVAGKLAEIKSEFSVYAASPVGKTITALDKYGNKIELRYLKFADFDDYQKKSVKKMIKDGVSFPLVNTMINGGRLFFTNNPDYINKMRFAVIINGGNIEIKGILDNKGSEIEVMGDLKSIEKALREAWEEEMLFALPLFLTDEEKMIIEGIIRKVDKVTEDYTEWQIQYGGKSLYENMQEYQDAVLEKTGQDIESMISKMRSFLQDRKFVPKELEGLEKQIKEIKNSIKEKMREEFKKLSIGGELELKVDRFNMCLEKNWLLNAAVHVSQVILSEDDPAAGKWKQLTEDIISYRLGSYQTTSSPAIASELEIVVFPKNPIGGIDLTDRALHIKLERVGSFASTPLLLPQVKNAQDLDLDKEFAQVEALASSGINPNSHRLLELFTACHYRGEFGERLTQIISCLKASSAIQEAEAIDSDEDFRLALMMPEVLS